MNKIKNEITVMNTVLCLAVIFIHVSSQAVVSLPRPSAVYFAVFTPWRLSSFAVQGFIFLSGLKLMLSKKHKKSFLGYLLNRLKIVIIPYIIWVAIYYLYFWKRGYFEFSAKEFAGYLLRGDLSAHFYFVIIIIQFYLLAPLWGLMTKKLNAYIAVVLVLFITLLLGQNIPVWFNDRIFTTYLVYWVAGCYAGENYESFITAIKQNKFIIFSFATGAAALDVYYGLRGAAGGGYPSFYETLHTLFCLGGIVSLFILCGYIPKLKTVSLISSASYYIYLTHCLVLVVTESFIHSVKITGVLRAFAVKYIVVNVVSVVLCVLYSYIKNKVTVNLFTKHRDMV